jgi:hypothetical protein
VFEGGREIWANKLGALGLFFKFQNKNESSNVNKKMWGGDKNMVYIFETNGNK